MTPVPPLITRLSRATRDDHLVRGRRVLAELLGSTSVYDLAALALDGPALTAADHALLGDLATCVFAPDPRIWPSKIVRVASAYGSPMAGLAAGFLPLLDALAGPWVVGHGAALLTALAEDVGGHDAAPDAAVRAWVDARLAAGGRFPGFGVPFRDRDERTVALERVIAARGYGERPWWRLLKQLEAALVATKGLTANIAGAGAAVELDLGFTPAQISLLSLFLLLPNYLGNALEGAEQAAEVLRELPPATVAWRGPAPRTSPRAAATRPGDDMTR